LSSDGMLGRRDRKAEQSRQDGTQEQILLSRLGYVGIWRGHALRKVGRKGKGRMSETVSVREVLRLLLVIDAYPRQDDADRDRARELEAGALAKGEGARGSPGDPPEFRAWLEALRRPGIRNDEREAVYEAMSDYFEASATPARRQPDPE
jgi:hypothetical protein